MGSNGKDFPAPPRILGCNGHGGVGVNKEFTQSINEYARFRIRIWTDATGATVYHIGLEMALQTPDDYRCVLSYDCCEGKGHHGHRHRANGDREPIRSRIPAHYTIPQALDWAKQDCLQRLAAEKARFQSELEGLGA